MGQISAKEFVLRHWFLILLGLSLGFGFLGPAGIADLAAVPGLRSLLVAGVFVFHVLHYTTLDIFPEYTGVLRDYFEPGQPPYEELLPVFSTDQPEVHDIVHEMRRLTDEYDDRQSRDGLPPLGTKRMSERAARVRPSGSSTTKCPGGPCRCQSSSSWSSG